MDAKIRDKSSSRSGRFKKKLVSESALREEAPLIEARMTLALKSLRENLITDSEFAAIYLIAILSHREPKNWAGARRPTLGIDHKLQFKCRNISELGIPLEKNIIERLSSVDTLGDLFNEFALKSTPVAVNHSILNWSTGRYPLELMFRIPNSLEVLDQQTRGRRCVTVLLDSKRTSQYILGERDALSFTMHDLIHADHFYRHPVSFEGQLGFYGLMEYCLKQNHFEIHLKHQKFAEELDYLISDMNAYAVHLLKCFKAAIFHYHLDGKVFFDQWTSIINATSEERNAFLLLNSKDYIPEEHDSYLLNFLGKWKRQTL